ncbi:MAG TPA: hypothetical protein VMR34_05235 [Candidatus Saccharimonadales bacterium]|nr:hypothetical protein [Candidatus Saccharimonadales bacterium]
MIDIPVDLAVIDIANLNVAGRPYLRGNPGTSTEHGQSSALLFQTLNVPYLVELQWC